MIAVARMAHSNFFMYARANAAVLTSAEIEQCIKSTILGEVYTTPKPGLVDRHDNGAHHDMNVYTFERSADAITPYLAKMFFEGYFWKRNLQECWQKKPCFVQQARSTHIKD